MHFMYLAGLQMDKLKLEKACSHTLINFLGSVSHYANILLNLFLYHSLPYLCVASHSAVYCFQSVAKSHSVVCGHITQ